MKNIEIERVLELVVDAVIARDNKMHSLKEKMQLLEKIKAKAFYDNKLRAITCAANNSNTAEVIPAYNFLILERVFAEDDDTENPANDDALYGWILWCFDSLDELKTWFTRAVEVYLDIGYIEAIYMMDLHSYKEVNPKYYVKSEGRKVYISPLYYWGADDEVELNYEMMGLELLGVAEISIDNIKTYHLGYTLEDICDRIILNELVDFACIDKDGKKKGYFTYEGQKYPFTFCTANGLTGVEFFNPDGTEMVDARESLRPLKDANDKV